MTYIDFTQATFRAAVNAVEQLRQSDTLLCSLVYRPATFQRNDIRWIAGYSWRSAAKERGIAALKEVKRDPDPQLLKKAAEPISALIRQLFGDSPATAVTAIPCGHSRRPDCFGKRLAQSVAEVLELPFVQVFADRPCAGVSHPKESIRLPPLRQIATPPKSAILVDDVATSGRHLEEAVLALRRLSVTTTAFVWISGSSTGGAPLSRKLPELGERRAPGAAPKAPLVWW